MIDKVIAEMIKRADEGDAEALEYLQSAGKDSLDKIKDKGDIPVRNGFVITDEITLY